LLTLTLIFPWTIYELLSNIAFNLETISPAMSRQIIEKRTSLIGLLLLLQLGVSFFAFIILIFFTHKIAGPLYKLTQFLIAKENNNSKGRLFYRKGDYFHELADQYNKTFATINEQQRKDIVYISEANSYIANLSLILPEDKKIVLSEITMNLEKIKKNYEEL
jgi:nitrogen fixation/metabolism regulation signal transduction histidine kinase